jgi:hypothetical protein
MLNKFLKPVLSLMAVVFVGFGLWSCSDNTAEDTNKKQKMNHFMFDESVVFLQNINSENLHIVEIINFNPDLKLEIEYSINDIKYTDSGEYNDKFAGDGIYTSIEATEHSNEDYEVLNIGENFKYTEQLNSYLKDRYGYDLEEIIENNTTNFKVKPKASIKVGCKIVTRECPETHWYNSCIFSSPCTCVYLEDCELSIEVGI